MVCCLRFAEWKISMGHRKPCSVPINKQVKGGVSTQKKKGCLIQATLLQQNRLSGFSRAVQPGWRSGPSTAELQLWWWTKPWRGRSQGTRVHVPTRNVSWHFPWPGASVDPTTPYLSLLLVLGGWNYGWEPHRRPGPSTGRTMSVFCQGWDSNFTILAQPKTSTYLSDIPQPPAALTATQLSFWALQVGTWTGSLFPLVARL